MRATSVLYAEHRSHHKINMLVTTNNTYDHVYQSDIEALAPSSVTTIDDYMYLGQEMHSITALINVLFFVFKIQALARKPDHSLSYLPHVVIRMRVWSLYIETVIRTNDCAPESTS